AAHGEGVAACSRATGEDRGIAMTAGSDSRGVTLFDTAIGRCGIAWRESGILGVQLPERRDGRTRDRLRNRVPTAGGEAPPPPSVRAAIAGIAALLRGERADLSGVALEMNGLPP